MFRSSSLSPPSPTCDCHPLISLLLSPHLPLPAPPPASPEMPCSLYLMAQAGTQNLPLKSGRQNQEEKKYKLSTEQANGRTTFRFYKVHVFCLFVCFKKTSKVRNALCRSPDISQGHYFITCMTCCKFAWLSLLSAP